MINNDQENSIERCYSYTFKSTKHDPHNNAAALLEMKCCFENCENIWFVEKNTVVRHLKVICHSREVTYSAK
jgi:hypothetical protein